MALCVVLDGAALVAVGEFTEACQGFALMTAQEFADSPTLTSLFASPDAEGVRSAFMAGLSLPLILWLVSWGFSTVVSWIGHQPDVVYHDEN